MPVVRMLLMLLLVHGVAEAVEITEWEVPWLKTRPRDPDVAPDGRVWFVGQGDDYVAVFDPADESFQRFELESGTGPHNLIVAADGMVWYAGNRAAHIGRLDPKTGVIHRIPMPDRRAHDPHTLVFDGRGHIWFTVQQGNFIGRLNLASEKVDLVEVPTAKARPYGIVVDPAGRPWAVLLGSNKLASVDPRTLQIQEVTLPREKARPRRIARTSDSRLWYVDYRQGYLGAYDPGTGAFQEWPAPSGKDSGPYGLAVDAADRLWFVETFPDPNRLVGFDSDNGQYLGSYPIPSGAGSVRHMVFDPPRNAIWFGTDSNTLGRAKLP